MKKRRDEDDDSTEMVECPEVCQAYHTIKKTAALLNVSTKTVYNLMEKKELHYFEPCIGRRIHHQEISRYLKTKAAASIDKSVCAVSKRGRPKKAEPCRVCASSQGVFVCFGVVNSRPMKIKARISPAYINFVRIGDTSLERCGSRTQRAPDI